MLCIYTFEHYTNKLFAMKWILIKYGELFSNVDIHMCVNVTVSDYVSQLNYFEDSAIGNQLGYNIFKTYCHNENLCLLKGNSLLPTKRGAQPLFDSVLQIYSSTFKHSKTFDRGHPCIAGVRSGVFEYIGIRIGHFFCLRILTILEKGVLQNAAR
jgi:hypothetical protein